MATDPVICELAYAWYCPPGGLILDPFCVDTTRGLVAAKMGRRYLGFGLSLQRSEAAKEVSDLALDDASVTSWFGQDIRAAGSVGPADFIFSVPPEDMGAKDYRDVVARACRMLAPNRFACFVTGDLRDSNGALRNLPGETVTAFVKAGLRYHDEAILILTPGGVGRSARRVFERQRSLAAIHRRVLCFVKGDPLAAALAVGKCEFDRGPFDDDDDDEGGLTG